MEARMGEILQLTEKQYREFDALNVSRLCLMGKSPQHYLRGFKEETQAMRFGTAVHMAFLEPQRFKETYVVEPSEIVASARGEDGKRLKGDKKAMQPVNRKVPEHREILGAWRQAQEEKGSLVLTPEELNNMAGMLNSIREEIQRPLQAHEVSLRELFTGDREVALVGQLYGRLVKGRLDVDCKTRFGRTGVDFKKVGRSAAPADFARDVYNFHYDAKAAWYKKLFGLEKFFWIVVEENDPHAIGIYDAEDFLEMGEMKLNKWIGKLDECERLNSWPWYTRGAERLSPTSWQIKKLEDGDI